MSSTPKRRPNPHFRNPKSFPNGTSSNSHGDPDPSSSSSSFPPLKFLTEPSPDLFPSRDEFLRLLALLAVAASVAFSCNFLAGFFARPPKLPFCDTNTDSHDFLLPDFCEPCPENGECHGGKLECVRGYRKHGNLCVEDGDINETAKKLSERVEMRVCEGYAQFLCYRVGTVWVHEDEIWDTLNDLKLIDEFGLDSASHNYAKQRAFEIVSKSLEKTTNIYGIKELKCPDALAECHKPFKCRARQWFFKHVLVLIPAFALLVGCTSLVLKFHQRRQLSIRAEELYCQVCDILEENAFMSKSANSEGEPWVVASWLRDHLLLPRERKEPKLWKKVEELVQDDSRLDRYPKLVKGEPKVVWEWQVEGSLSSSRLRKKHDTHTLNSSHMQTDMNTDRASRRLSTEAVKS